MTVWSTLRVVVSSQSPIRGVVSMKERQGLDVPGAVTGLLPSTLALGDHRRARIENHDARSHARKSFDDLHEVAPQVDVLEDGRETRSPVGEGRVGGQTPPEREPTLRLG